ncbi:hypothetical protein [Synechococcus sp. PCC 7502]|uniref:hypothetical protein n=1 Tax=Synechococcus sp. PCC 7502 TaxID=1173263 RepID=UPI00059BE6A9|nr:hypothetical protein [Synechococcus sp. PCC 7502]
MEVNNTWQSWLYKSSFWLAALGSALLVMHLQLPYVLSPNLNYVIVRGLAWVGVVSLIWQRRKTLPIDSSDLISIAIGATLITLVLVRSWFFRGSNDVLLDILPLFSAVGLVLLASGFKNLKLYKRELALVLVSVIPFGILMPIVR